MKKTVFIIVLLLLLRVNVSGQSGGPYYFFSDQDIENISKSAETEWGKTIIDSLKTLVDNRLHFPMEAPMLEGGHSHDYFCPIHNLQFVFDYSKPTAHYCEHCKKYWSNINKINWAWVNILHNRNKDFLNACTYLYLATKNERYVHNIKYLLLDYALKYPTYMVHNIRREQVQRESGKMYGQSLDEAVFADYAARAYFTAKPFMSLHEIKQIENGYLRPCAELLLRQNSGGNWQVWHNSGIIALGVALANDTIIDVALNNSKYGYHKLMELNVLDDGWWSEGSPTYHFYPLEAMLLSADALRCRNINLYDNKLYKMFVAPASAVYNNLQFASHNDGWYGESLSRLANLYEVAAIRFNSPYFRDVLSLIYSKDVRNSTEALLSSEDFSQTKTNLKRQSTNFPQSGIGVLCAGDNTVVLKYGPHGGGHGHPDKLSISIHDGEKEIVSDLGTTAYGVPDYRRWYRRTLSHSTLSVDGKDQKAVTGQLIRFEPYKDGGFIETTCTGAYENVEMNRSLLLKENKLIDIFTAKSPYKHTYDYVLIFTEKPEFNLQFIPSELNDSEVYSCIKNLHGVKAHKNITIVVGGSKLKIESLSVDDFEVFCGEAPGIPFSKFTVKENSPHPTVVYPLILRIKNNELKIKTTWNIK